MKKYCSYTQRTNLNLGPNHLNLIYKQRKKILSVFGTRRTTRRRLFWNTWPIYCDHVVWLRGSSVVRMKGHWFWTMHKMWLRQWIIVDHCTESPHPHFNKTDLYWNWQLRMKSVGGLWNSVVMLLQTINKWPEFDVDGFVPQDTTWTTGLCQVSKRWSGNKTLLLFHIGNLCFWTIPKDCNV